MNDVANAEMWDVEIANGIIRTMTLDELDSAYQNGSIDEDTRVRQSGAPNWSTLAAIAGHEDSYTPEPVNSLSPIQVSVPPPPAVPREFAHLTAHIDDDDVDELALRRGKRKPMAVVGGIVGVAAIAGLVAFAAARANTTSALQAAAAAAAMAPPPAMTSLPAPAETSDKRALSDDQKRALLEADQKRAAEADKKRAKSAPRGGSGVPRTKGDGLLKGGDKFDPLNGAL